MKTTRRKRSVSHCRVALEISSHDLTFVIVDGKAGTQRHVRGYHLPWLQKAASLDGDDGQQELAEALGPLVQQEKLAGAPANVALSSDFCVTRVVAGNVNKVQSEMRSLRERTSHYLWLGAGQKALAESSQAIDAKRIQTWLTVTNHSVLERVVAAVSQSGLQVGLIEHSMVAICRALGRREDNQGQPVMVIELTERGLDLGVAYEGLLLFDYRPGGIDAKERIGEIILRHLDRIQRYCHRHFAFAQGHIEHVYICGEPTMANRVAAQFTPDSRLRAHVLDAQTVCPTWEYDETFADDPRFVSPLGSLLVEDEQLRLPHDERGLPDLMDYFRQAWREPLVPALIRAFWPVAAMVLVALGIYGAALSVRATATRVEQQTARLDQDRVRVVEMKRQIEEAITKSRHLETISQQVLNPPWHDVISTVGQCLPEGAWLEGISVDDRGKMSITGVSQSEDLIFQFVQYLQQVPQLDRVNLEAQRPTRSPAGSAIAFDVKCDFNGSVDFSERIARND